MKRLEDRQTIKDLFYLVWDFYTAMSNLSKAETKQKGRTKN